MVIFILTSLSCNRELLYHECMFMYNIDFWGPTVCIGRLYFFSSWFERGPCNFRIYHMDI
jgi:hypothetical protein